MGENVPRRLKRFSRQEGDENTQQQASQPAGPAIEEKKQEQIKSIFMALGKKEPDKEGEKKGFFGKPKTEGKGTGQATEKGEKEQSVSEALFEQLRQQKKRETKKESISLAVNEIKKFKEQHNRYPSGGEYDEIAENIYQQIKQAENREESQRQSMRRQPKTETKEEKQVVDNPFGKQEQQKAETMESQLKGLDLEKLDVKDLFGEDEKELKLEDIASGSDDELKLEGLDEEIDSMSKEFETEKNSCPNCKTKTNEIVFCPECGTAFCNHCAKAANTEAGITKYTCPKCSREVKAQK